ncbi:MAG TPA: M48 family metalloprotease [Candidatus Angelobacter sp.]
MKILLSQMGTAAKRGLTAKCVLFSSCALLLLSLTSSGMAADVKVRGYITSLPDQHSIAILDDVIAYDTATRIEQDCGAADHGQSGLAVGVLIEAEGAWTAPHRFSARKVSCDAGQFTREVSESAYFQEEPLEAGKITAGTPLRLKADGELLLLTDTSQKSWTTRFSEAGGESSSPKIVGSRIHYRGVRSDDGLIHASFVELGSPPPADAYNNPGGIKILPAVEPKSGIRILEFRKGDKVQGRLKLFPVIEVQDYVKKLGLSLLPGAAEVTKRPVEFRFFVVEDASINAEALPDGTIFVNTGLLGALENESQLAFVLSHEIAHVLQAHHWREVNDTRAKRVLITIAALAGSYYIGNLSLYLGQIGLADVVNGYSRRIENQADRLGLQNCIDHGYDPGPAVGFFRIMVERYRQRSTSAIWSNHDSSLLRGSFLTVQLIRQYPQERFAGTKLDTPAFQTMKDAMGPVKIE